jgi:hypothetical protein
MRVTAPVVFHRFFGTASAILSPGKLTQHKSHTLTGAFGRVNQPNSLETGKAA